MKPVHRTVDLVLAGVRPADLERMRAEDLVELMTSTSLIVVKGSEVMALMGEEVRRRVEQAQREFEG